MLRDKHDGTNTLLLEIPIVFANSRKGAKKIFINHNRIIYYLDVHEEDILGLRRDGLVQPEVPVKILKSKINYERLADEYKMKLECGMYATRSALAKSLGVSRAWISMVMRRGMSSPI